MGKLMNITLIKKYISDNHLTKKEFCRKCDISIYTLRKIFNNDFTTKIDKMIKIARVLNVHLSELVNF